MIFGFILFRRCLVRWNQKLWKCLFAKYWKSTVPLCFETSGRVIFMNMTRGNWASKMLVNKQPGDDSFKSFPRGYRQWGWKVPPKGTTVTWDSIIPGTYITSAKGKNPLLQFLSILHLNFLYHLMCKCLYPWTTYASSFLASYSSSIPSVCSKFLSNVKPFNLSILKTMYSFGKLWK